MFLGRFKYIDVLGQGTYGKVYLVEDLKNNKKLYALKEVSYQCINVQPALVIYLEGQIRSMKSLNSPNIVSFYQDLMEENNNVYLLLQYCNGGDLFDYQKKQQNNMFTIKRATQILAGVINGLEHIHQKGFVHRDIKLQNILIKNEKQKEIFKITDFGFTKKESDIRNTFIGTLFYMSPQIMLKKKRNEKKYTSSVDIWAFGVLFYKMITNEFPFQASSYQELCKQVANYRFGQGRSQNTKKEAQLAEDLLQNIFKIDPKLRFTLTDIKAHKIFAEYFPVVPKMISQSNVIKEQPKGKKVSSSGNVYSEIEQVVEGEDYQKPINIFSSPLPQKSKQFCKQRGLLQRKKAEIDFLKQIFEDFNDTEDSILEDNRKKMVHYFLLKYYVILLRQYKKNLTKQGLNDSYPGYKWNQYVYTSQFDKYFFKEISANISQHEKNYLKLYEEVNQKNINFIRAEKGFKLAIGQTTFDGDFKSSYRKTTVQTFEIIRQKMGSRSTNRLHYLITLCLIAHAFNNLLIDKESFAVIFKEYFDKTKKKIEEIDYKELRQWMLGSSKSTLDTITKSILKKYFNI